MSLHKKAIVVSPKVTLTGRDRTLSLDAKSLVHKINEVKRRDSSITRDDNPVDYTSILDPESQSRRFSEDLVDKETRHNLELRKLYRQIQRQVHCSDNNFNNQVLNIGTYFGMLSLVVLKIETEVLI